MKTISAKTTFISLIAIIATAVISCSKEDKPTPERNDEAKLTLKANYEVATKSTENGGEFAWLATDKIKVYTTDGGASEFTLTKGAGTPNADFTTDDAGITVAQVAVSPSAIYGSVDKQTTTATLTMPTYYYYTAGDTQAPMLAAVKEGNSSALSFKHVGAVVKITCTNVPSNARRITLWTKERRITGNFDLNYSNLGSVAIEAENLASNTFGSLSIYFTPDGNDMTFYFPVPVGNYPELRFVMYEYANSSYQQIAGTRQIYAPAGGIEIERGDLVNAKVTNLATWRERSDWNIVYEGMSNAYHRIKTSATGTDYYTMYLWKKSDYESIYNSSPASTFEVYANPGSAIYGIYAYSRANSSFPIGTEDYVAIMYGITNDAYHNPTGEYKVVEIPAFESNSAAYSDWLGSWTISGQNSSGTALTYNLTIAQAVPNKTFLINGWGTTATTQSYQFVADFDEATGALKLKNYTIANSNYSGRPASEYAIVIAGATNNNGYAYYNNNYIATIGKSGTNATILPTTAYYGSYYVTGMGFYLKYHTNANMPAVISSGNNNIQFATASMTKN